MSRTNGEQNQNRTGLIHSNSTTNNSRLYQRSLSYIKTFDDENNNNNNFVPTTNHNNNNTDDLFRTDKYNIVNNHIIHTYEFMFYKKFSFLGSKFFFKS